MSSSFISVAVVKYTDTAGFRGERVHLSLQVLVTSQQGAEWQASEATAAAHSTVRRREMRAHLRLACSPVLGSVSPLLSMSLAWGLVLPRLG